MAPRSFRKFSKLPIEIRLRIFNLATEPRIVRAKWETITYDKEYRTVYRLSAGPVPKVLQINRESREEAKRRYIKVYAQLALVGGRKCGAEQIWVNFDMDTLYFVNYPASYGFLTWFRRISKKAQRENTKASKTIKYIAFSAHVLRRLGSADNKLDMFYTLAVEHPELKDISIVLDNGQFYEDKKPSTYKFTPPIPLKAWKTSGGRWGNLEMRSKLLELFGTFWTGENVNPKVLAEFKKFRANHPEWVEPDFPSVSIRKKTTPGF